MNKISLKISDNLTPEEIETFQVIKNVIEMYIPTTTARVAGGWVRDKLLGVHSDDIDIMLDNVSGATFAQYVAVYLGIKPAHVIEANPDASKHLETAGITIRVINIDVDLDFAMARTEVYSDTSRIPEIKPATAEEDAFRRDLTINSLFYNINKNEVEDFTGMGLMDLVHNVIRTPVDPIKTFNDDPLRIFRVIRFASRYEGTIDNDTFNAMKNSKLKELIQTKISKERIHDELVKTLNNPGVIRAFFYFKEFGIIEDIINYAIKNTKYEGHLYPLEMNQNNPHHDLNLWHHTVTVIAHIVQKYDSDDKMRVPMILAGLFHDFGKLYDAIHVIKEDRTSYHGHEDESAQLAEVILKYLKFDNDTIVLVEKLVRYHMDPHDLVRSEVSKGTYRKFIRRMSEAGLNWVDVVNHAACDAFSKSNQVASMELIDEYLALKKELRNAEESMTIEKNKVIPVLNGNEIMETLNIKPGIHMKEICEVLKDIQDETPDISKEEAKEKLKVRFGFKQSYY